ncbi:ferritin-like domain-containing protein [Sporichthya sp.]|uniref:ferritin-like domain-containing protein n=1 Tax=Sporichthya sp. TaxID=65475 RepID=UPI0018380D6C|nr:ferritin-like domain-containing protein [Sporichthya sp.]MBA3745745.1 ferritin-like domain-containing protein [Sporichthya sp.]
MSADQTVLGEVLGAEHAAIYGYGAIAAALSGTSRSVALQGLNVHRERRDRLRRMILDGGGKPVEAQPAYELPRPLGGFSAVVDLAAGIERDVALAYGALVVAADGDDRGFAALALQDAAVREATWREEAPRFPGLEDPGLPPEAPTPGATATP